jgi:hypothetical protein
VKRVSLALAVALALAAGGCGGGDDGKPDAKFTPGGGASPTADVTAKVKADYLAYWDAIEKAQSIPDPEDPGLKQHAIGADFKKQYTGISFLRHQHWRIKGKVGHRIEEVSVRGDTATLRDCVDPSKSQFNLIATGKPVVNQEPGKPGTARYVLRRRGGMWKVAESTDEGPTCS